MAVIAFPESAEQPNTDGVEDAMVIPFSRTLLGEGADAAEGSRQLAERRDSPVYFPGDPRLED